MDGAINSSPLLELLDSHQSQSRKIIDVFRDIGEGYDKGGPSLDSNFVPSIHVEDKKNTYCIGLKYDGQSSLEVTSYDIDHIQVFSKNSKKTYLIKAKVMKKILEASSLSFKAVIAEFVRRLNAR